jgi:hypothetical protein
MSEWLLFSVKWTIIHYSFWWDYVRVVLDQHADVDFYSASSLKQHSVSRHAAPLGHIILISNQSVVALTP